MPYILLVGLSVLLAACTSPSNDGMQTTMQYDMPVNGVITFKQ